MKVAIALTSPSMVNADRVGCTCMRFEQHCHIYVKYNYVFLFMNKWFCLNIFFLSFHLINNIYIVMKGSYVSHF